tara:strand:- start:543 stop:791 length:249 start_codon:yes stop_codon:yes gene_type:complete
MKTENFHGTRGRRNKKELHLTTEQAEFMSHVEPGVKINCPPGRRKQIAQKLVRKGLIKWQKHHNPNELRIFKMTNKGKKYDF